MFKSCPQIGLLLSLTFLWGVMCFAQDDLASIRKNVNVLAKGLQHDLNATKDTLVLKSSSRMYRVYTIGDTSGIIDQPIDGFEYQLPLLGLRKGRYAMAVDQLGKKIVFQVFIHKNIKPTISTAGLNDQALNKIEIIRELPDFKVVKNFIQRPIKPYNLTDLDRRNMESRADARRRNEIKRAQIIAARLRTNDY